MNQELSFGSIVREHRLGLPERTLVVKYQSRLETALLSGPLDLTQTVMDFAPGMWSSLSSPGGGQGLATVLEDAVTVRQGKLEKIYQAGETFIKLPNMVMEVGNATPEKTSMLP